MIQAPTTSTCLIAGWAENAITGLLPCPFLPSAGNQKIKAKGRSLEIISFERHRFAFYRLCLVKVWKYFLFFEHLSVIVLVGLAIIWETENQNSVSPPPFIISSVIWVTDLPKMFQGIH